MSAVAGNDAVRQVADAVLFEGYLLYPYRASAEKNRLRWQFGVLVPPSRHALEPSEASNLHTECVLELPNRDLATVEVTLRFLQIESRTVERLDGTEVDSINAGGRSYLPFDEGVVREVTVVLGVRPDSDGETRSDFGFPNERSLDLVEDAGATLGHFVRRREAVRGRIDVRANRLAGPYDLAVLAVDVQNTTDVEQSASRDASLRHSLVGAHLLLRSRDAQFVSLLDPPEYARDAVAARRNDGVFPVLAGEAGSHDRVLASPIVLYDYPAVAPESPQPLFDATEIDEILSLRTMALTDDEKREARATDPRAAQLIDAVDAMPPELFERLHGSIRYLRAMTRAEPQDHDEPVPWWDPSADPAVDPEHDSTTVDGVEVRRGARVRLHPRAAGASGHLSDAQDMFLEGRTATVHAVVRDVDGGCHLAVTLDDDPARDLQAAQGRFLYFAPAEVDMPESSP